MALLPGQIKEKKTEMYVLNAVWIVKSITEIISMSKMKKLPAGKFEAVFLDISLVFCKQYVGDSPIFK